MTDALTLRGVTFRPALFCAPMAGYTHSAFRRLVADFGGHGALFTEMLCARWLLSENLRRSPAVRRRPEEGKVIYQLMVADPGEVPPALDRLARLEPAGIDVNCACPAPNVRGARAGSELYEDRDRLAAILTAVRRRHAGFLTVKIRLGSRRDDWRGRLDDRLRLFEECGVDAVTLHPRFADEKLNRRARHALFSELAPATRLPLIASGDITGRRVIEEHPERFAGVAGIMVGRMALARPWVFAGWSGAGPAIDHREVWTRFFDYVCEDFPPALAPGRIKAFTAYYARNFLFGHHLFAAVQWAPDLPTLRARAVEFLSAAPALLREPCLQGVG